MVERHVEGRRARVTAWVGVLGGGVLVACLFAASDPAWGGGSSSTLGGAVGGAWGDPDSPGTLPPVDYPTENPFSEEKRVLGKILFWDEQLSSDNTVACATCHQHKAGGTDPRVARHPGVDGVMNTDDDVFGSPGLVRQGEGEDYTPDPVFALLTRVTNRSSPSVINAAYSPLAFWDGRATSEFKDPETGEVAIVSGGALESQIVGPPVSDVEMAHEKREWSQITAKLAGAVPLALGSDLPADVKSAILAHPSYPALFEEAFGDGAITARRIAFAIATYERTLVSDEADWDDYVNGNSSALTTLEVQGMELFELNCVSCHPAPWFTTARPGSTNDQLFRNIGLRPPGDDAGRMVVTGNPIDDRRFKVSSVRNNSLKASFAHTGEFQTLEEIVAFYADEQAQHPENIDPLMPIPLNAQEIQALTAFIAGGLTDSRVANGEFPFDAPTLCSERIATYLSEVGEGQAGTGGLVPSWIANTPPNIGNDAFKVGVMSGLAGATAELHVSMKAPVSHVVAGDFVVGPVELKDGGVAVGGFSTAHWAIPAMPQLAGNVYYMQWVVQDPGSPTGIARSRPLQVTMFCGESGCPDSCYADCDRSGSLDFFDFLCFLNAHAGNELAADCDANGVLDVMDMMCFQDAFVSGCP